jgi:hypothetical protein
VSLPTVSANAVLLSNSSTNELVSLLGLSNSNNLASTPSSSSGSTAESVVNSLVSTYVRSLESQRLTGLICLGVWIFVLLCGIVAIFWRRRRRGQIVSGLGGGAWSEKDPVLRPLNLRGDSGGGKGFVIGPPRLVVPTRRLPRANRWNGWFGKGGQGQGEATAERGDAAATDSGSDVTFIDHSQHQQAMPPPSTPVLRSVVTHMVSAASVAGTRARSALSSALTKSHRSLRGQIVDDGDHHPSETQQESSPMSFWDRGNVTPRSAKSLPPLPWRSNKDTSFLNLPPPPPPARIRSDGGWGWRRRRRPLRPESQLPLIAEDGGAASSGWDDDDEYTEEGDGHVVSWQPAAAAKKASEPPLLSSAPQHMVVGARDAVITSTPPEPSARKRRRPPPPYAPAAPSASENPFASPFDG